jgi:hypothetical protein
MSQDEPVRGDGWLIEAVSRHAKKYCGEIAFVIHETHSSTVHVDVHVTSPNPERPYYTLITSGMAQSPMQVPPEYGSSPFAELMMCLPAGWKIQEEYWTDKSSYWPIGLLRWLARYPHEDSTWLWMGHSVRGEEDGTPYGPNTKMSDLVLLEPRTIPEEAHWFHAEGRDIALLAVYPILRQELDFKMQRGTSALEELFLQTGVTELLDATRHSVVPMN